MATTYKILTEVPFSESYDWHGIIQPARYATTKRESTTLVEAPEFTRILKFHDWTQNNNSITAWMMDGAGVIYPMFQSDFLEMVQHAEAVGQGQFKGTWRMIQKAGRYGLINEDIQIIGD